MLLLAGSEGAAVVYGATSSLTAQIDVHTKLTVQVTTFLMLISDTATDMSISYTAIDMWLTSYYTFVICSSSSSYQPVEMIKNILDLL